MGIYKDGRKFVRKIGQCRKSDIDIYGNLGHVYDIRGKTVIFIGKEEKTYCLTKGKEYEILYADSTRWMHDDKFNDRMHERFKGLEYNKYHRRYEATHYPGGLITLINDKGHKRKYYHNMFKMVEDKNAKTK